MKKQGISVLLWCWAIFASAQSRSFTVAAMNVDGLPAKIATINVNPDSKGSEGAKAISNKLATKGYDIIGFSEDFNFHDDIMSAIGDIYNTGKHRGAINLGTSFIAIFNGLTFDTDGLELLWRKDINVGCESWTQWKDWNGKTDNGNDGLIKKGFRYYLADFGDGVLVDIYILHMDAEVTDKDIAARESQMQQLADDILRINPSMRPKIVMGDTNCRYTRDHLKTLFIDVINDDARYTITDAWIKKCKNNTYPTYGSNALMTDELGYVKGEIVDKIFFINPKYGLQLNLEKFFVDTDFNNEDGEPLADHYPVVATFSTSGTLYDPASYWDESYNSCKYRAYNDLYERLLPLTESDLPQTYAEELQALLTEHTSAQSDITDRMKSFLGTLQGYLTDNFYVTDYTKRLKIPAVEAEQQPASSYSCKQSVYLSKGWYHFSTAITANANASTNLIFGDYRTPIEEQAEGSEDSRIDIYAYHTGGNITIGAESDKLFEADDFRLDKLTYLDPTGIESVTPASNQNAEAGDIEVKYYSPDGRLLTSPQRGLNIILRSDGYRGKVMR